MTSQSARDYLLPVLLVCMAVAAVFVMLGCSPARSAADVDKCLAAADARAEIEIAKRCDTPTLAECPFEAEILANWEREARKCR